MTTVVTGATGHVGANLIRALSAEGRKIRVVIHEVDRWLDGFEVETVAGDVRDLDSLIAAFDSAEVVYHLASKISINGDPDGSVRNTNINGARNIAAACLDRKVGRLVHFSSVHAFSDQHSQKTMDETRPLLENEWAPAYDKSKAAGQREITAAVARGLDAVIVNPTGVIGPNDFRPSRMGRVILDLYQGKMPALVEGGFNWVDVRDVVAGAMAAEKSGKTGECYLLSGNWVSFREISSTYQEITGKKMPKFCCPFWLAKIGAPFAEAWANLTKTDPLFTSESLNALISYPDISNEKARRDLGYAPRPFAETLADTYNWFCENGYLETALVKA